MKPHHRIFFTQFAVAVSLGGLIARLPDLQTKFGLSEGQLGILHQENLREGSIPVNSAIGPNAAQRARGKGRP